MRAEPVVEILDVSIDEPEGAATGIELESPVAGQTISGYAFLLRGTVLTREDAPPIRWIAVLGNERVARGSTRDHSETRHEFSMAIGATGQPRDFELDVAAVFDDGTRSELARITARRAPLESAFEPTIQPLMVTTLGRSGSSLFAATVGSHPQVVAYRPFGREPRAAAYWTDVFRELADPVSAARQLAHGTTPDMSDRGWWLGKGVPQEFFEDDTILEWLGGDHIRSLAGYCQGRVESLYTRLATEAGRAARYFVEKTRPDGIASTMRELYPESREVILVRDYRDMFCSMRAFSTLTGTQLFGQTAPGEEAEHLDRLKTQIEFLISRWAAAPDCCHLVRYEDLVLDPATTMRHVLDYAGLESSTDVIDAMSAIVGGGGPISEGHRTTASGTESIGRWRRELDDDLKERCLEKLGPALEELGYEPH